MSSLRVHTGYCGPKETELIVCVEWMWAVALPSRSWMCASMNCTLLPGAMWKLPAPAYAMTC
jgi:hypothetical protein